MGEIPFSSERKLMSTLHRDKERGDKQTVFTKGAPDVLLARCSSEVVGENPVPLTAGRRAEIEKTNLALADQALRTLGVAIRRLTADVPVSPGSEVESSVEQDSSSRD